MVMMKIHSGDFSHFVENSFGDGFVAFNIDHCENCGCECQAPNTINLLEQAVTLQSLGMKQASHLPQELGWSEELEGAVCEDCYYGACEEEEG